MRLRTMASGGAEDGNSQSRKISRSITQNNPRAKAHTWNETSPEFRKLNRQKIQFWENQISTQKLHVSSRTSSVTEESSLHISNRELLGLEILQLIENEHLRPDLIANFEPNHFPVFQAGCSK